MSYKIGMILIQCKKYWKYHWNHLGCIKYYCTRKLDDTHLKFPKKWSILPQGKHFFPLPPGSMLASLKLNILRNGKFAMFAKNSNHGFIEQTLTPTLNRGEGGVENVNFPSRNRARRMSLKINGNYCLVHHQRKSY